MMSTDGEPPPGEDCHLILEGRSWPCRPGDVIGRAGSVAPEILRAVPVLSRRHLMVEFRGTEWHVTALPDSRNDTFLNGMPMIRGVPYPIDAGHLLQVDSFRFQLGRVGAVSPASLENTAPVSPFRTISNFPEVDETHSAGESAALLHRVPVALVETDIRLHITAANRPAHSLLGADPVGRDLDEWIPERTMIRSRLLSLEDGSHSGAVETELSLPAGRAWIELQASRDGGQLVILLRDITAGRDRESGRERLAAGLARKSGILAELSLSRAFQEGDVARSLTLLAHRASDAMACRRVSAWLRPESSPADARRVTCQVCHDPVVPAVTGFLTDLAYCPMFFDQLATGEPWVEAEAGTPVMQLLQEIGFAMKETGRLLCVALQHADGFYGVLSFERGAEGEAWTESERQFALCLASHGLLALQTSERREALRRLQGSEARMTAELEEANRYVQRILPEPILSGPVTAEWHMAPSEALGGDSFGYHWVGDLFVMYILDVVGHGTGMALLSISVLNSVRARLLMGESAMADPAGVLMDLNATFPMENQNNMLFSMWYGVFDRRTRQLTYASAGHPPAILLHGDAPEDAEDYITLGTDGPAVGAMEGIQYTNGCTTVDHGAKLYIFTDGAFEIPLGPEREWTFDEFIAVVRSTRYMSGGEPAYLRKRIGALCSADFLPDDFTVVRLSFEQ